jgi:hypothetical protein
MRQRLTPLFAVLSVAAGVERSSAQAQESGRPCVVLCAPSLRVEPTLTIEHLLARHRVQSVSGGEITRVDRATLVEMILALDVPTTIPHVGLTLESIWPAFARDNAVTLEFELNLHFLESDATGGWVGAHLDVIDQFSPAKRPTATRAYTHKLDFELDVGVAPFNRVNRGWLREVELEASFDYLATGLPRAGEVVNGERYLDDASPWALSLVLVLPIAPLVN